MGSIVDLLSSMHKLSMLCHISSTVLTFALSSPRRRRWAKQSPSLVSAFCHSIGRRDLAASLTKLHLFRLTQYDTVIFLDADTLVCRPLTPLFDTVNPERPFAAAPDSGWPDAFNSGVMVVKPSLETFNDLVKMMNERGSWDGGDQGLLNDYFPNWHRLSFTYNVTPSAYYT